MQDHDKYLIELKIFGQEKKFYIAISHEIPETEIDLVIKEEVFQFLERETRYNFSRILL